MDDWILFANSRDNLQTLVRRIAALLRTKGLTIKPEKVQWVASDQINEVCLGYDGEIIQRQPELIYMGLKLDERGHPQTHLDYRLAHHFLEGNTLDNASSYV